MNDQVKQVIHKAGFDWYRDSGRLLPSCRSAEDLEHLVNKVVCECALIAGLMEHQNRKNIGANILDHFGIKE